MDRNIENYEQVNALTNKQSSRSHNLSDISINEKNYIQAKEYYETSVNPSEFRSQGLDGIEINEDKYILEKDYYETNTNKGRNINTKTLDELHSNNKTGVKDVYQYELESGVNTGYTLLTEIPDFQLQHHMPKYTTTAVLNDPTVYKRVEHKNSIELRHNLPQTNSLRNVTKIEDMDNFNYASSRDYKLPELTKKGEFTNSGIIPKIDRSEIPVRIDSHKEKIRKYMNDTQFSRF